MMLFRRFQNRMEVVHTRTKMKPSESDVSANFNTVNIWSKTRFLIILWMLMVDYYQECGALDLVKCSNALGMESRRISDNAITASSSYEDQSVGPKSARIRQEINGGAWCPKEQITMDSYEYLQIDLDQLTVITKVEVQGRFGNGQGKEYAEHFLLEYQREDDGEWIRFRDRRGREQFDGNTNTYLAEVCEVSPPIICKRIRFIPYSLRKRTVCMRVELYGCNWNASTTPPAIQPIIRSDISCDGNQMSVHVPADLFPSGQRVTWTDPLCDVIDNGTHLVDSISLNSCGTSVSFNQTHVIFENELVSHTRNATNTSIIDFGSEMNTVVPVQCIYARREQVTTSYRPVQGRVRFYEKRMGHMEIEMQQAMDPTFSSTYGSQTVARPVNLNDNIFIKISTAQGNQSTIGLNVDRCLATPSPSPLDTEFQELTTNGCPSIPSVTLYQSPHYEVHLSFRAFQFTNHPGAPVYVHCEVYACPVNDPQCTTGCSTNTRRRRAAEGGPKSHLVSSGPYQLKPDQAAGSSTALIAVTALCVFLAVVATAFGVLAWRRRLPPTKTSS